MGVAVLFPDPEEEAPKTSGSKFPEPPEVVPNPPVYVLVVKLVPSR